MAVDAWHPHLRQATQFVLAGVAQLALDSGVFIATTALGLPIVPANLLGRLSGATLGFWLNGRYTFGKQKLDRGHALRFAVVWIALTCLSTVLVSSLAAHVGLHRAWLAKPLVEAGIAVLGFFLWKYVVYR
jgi:putative flippase GtrA